MREGIKNQISMIVAGVIALIAIFMVLGLVVNNMDSVTTENYIENAIVHSKSFIPDKAPHYRLEVEFDGELYESGIDWEIYNKAYPNQEVLVQVTDFISTKDNSLYNRKVRFYDFKED